MVRVITSAPGKIILCGEHAVVYDKEALAFSLSTRTTCCIEQDLARPSMLSLKIPYFDLDQTFDLEKLEEMYNAIEGSVEILSNPKVPSLLDDEEGVYEKYLASDITGTMKAGIKLVLVLYMHLAHRFLDTKKAGIRIVFKTDLPIGSGLGSSASFAVAAVSAMLVLTGTLDSNQRNWSDNDYDLINGWAFQSERIIHGTPSGIDNSVITYGHCVSFKAKKINRLKEFSNLNMKILMVDTQKSRSTKALVSGVRERKEKFPEIYESILNAMEQVTERFKSCLATLSQEDVEETYQELEILVDLNQNLLNAIGVGHSTINQVVSMCAQNNLHAKLTGAGGGGCVFAIIPPSFPEKDLTNLIMRFEKETNFRAWIAGLGEDGVLLDTYE